MLIITLINCENKKIENKYEKYTIFAVFIMYINVFTVFSVVDVNGNDVAIVVVVDEIVVCRKLLDTSLSMWSTFPDVIKFAFDN